MKNGKIDLWISGHTHCPLTQGNYCPTGIGIDPDYPFSCYQRFGAGFIDSGSVLNNQSRYLIFRNNSNLLEIKTFNHDSGFEDFIKIIPLAKKVEF